MKKNILTWTHIFELLSNNGTFLLWYSKRKHFVLIINEIHPPFIHPYPFMEFKSSSSSGPWRCAFEEKKPSSWSFSGPARPDTTSSPWPPHWSALVFFKMWFVRASEQEMLDEISPADGRNRINACVSDSNASAAVLMQVNYKFGNIFFFFFISC